MAKFILIDNSITDTAGHYYQYAVHSLKAAEEAGYTPILATNKKYSDLQSLPWKIFPAYKYGFWTTLDKRGATLVKVYQRILTRIHRLKYRAIFSWLGFSWLIRDQLSDYMRTRIPADENMKVPTIWLILSSLLVPLFLFAMRFRNRLRNVHKTILYSIFLAKPIDPITGTPFDRERAQRFCEDTRILFRQLQLEEGDIVFIPTVGTVEMLGFLEYFKKERSSKNATWHLLFRREIYTGRGAEYWRQDEKLRPLRNALFHFIQHLNGQSVYFYTDSDELTTQYNRLGVAQFHTLPIPHTISPRTIVPKNAPLLITYIGDARTEKGYHYLPNIINDLWVDYVKTGKIRFAVQSTFNIPGGEPRVVIARSQLQDFPRDKVQLIYNSLSSEEYEKLLLSSDIVLLPYDSNSYYARSSGILVECLAAGIPVIVPAKTWMAGQFVGEIYRYHSTLRNRMKVVESYSGMELKWHSAGNPESDALVNEELTFGGESTKVYCWLKRPMPATHLFISFNIEAQIRTSVIVDIVQLRYDRPLVKYDPCIVEKINGELVSSVLLPLTHDSPLLYISFKNPYGSDTIRISKVNIDFLTTDQPTQRCPLGAVGLVYNNPDEISSLLREMFDNYLHYRETARNFAPKYFKVHNANRLIEKIVEAATQGSRAQLTTSGR